MISLFRAGFATGVLALMLGSAHATTAGHMFRSQGATAPADQELTGTITKPVTRKPDVAGSKTPAPKGIGKPMTSPTH